MICLIFMNLLMNTIDIRNENIGCTWWCDCWYAQKSLEFDEVPVFWGWEGGQYFCRGLLLLSLVLLLLQSMFLTFFLLILFFWFWILFLLNLIKWSFSCKTSTKQQAYDFSGFYQNSIFSWKKKNFQNFHCWDFVNMQKLGGWGMAER